MNRIEISFYNLKVVKENSIEYNYLRDKKIMQSEAVHEIAINVFELHERAEECMFLFTLNTKNEINGVFEVSRGSLNASIVHPREIFKRAILQNANSIILLHNHPSGDVTPSKEDIAITKRLVEAGELLKINVLDHIIIGNNKYKHLSMQRSRML